MSDERRYGQNAHLWRRTYGYARRKPIVTTFFDENLNVSRSLDLNTNFRHRDFFEINGYNISGPQPDWIPVGFEYEEGFIYFDNEDFKTANFNTAFRFDPYVIYTAVPNEDNSYNINVYGTAHPTLTQMYIGTSAPFTGYVHYIAVAAPSWPQTSTSGSSTHLYAGAIDLNNVYEYTASYALPPAGTNYVYYDTIHENNFSTANTNTLNISANETNSVNELSANTTNRLHFIVFRLS